MGVDTVLAMAVVLVAPAWIALLICRWIVWMVNR